MIARQYVNGIKVEGLEVSTDGLVLAIQPGSITVAGRTATLEESTTFEFPVSESTADVQIGFDLMGRLYVFRHVRGQPREQPLRFGVLTHYVYFTLPPGTTDLADVMIHVLRESIN